MKQLRYTLTSDGSSDRALMAVIDWLFEQHRQAAPMTVLSQFADIREGRHPSRRLVDRLKHAIGRFPCDILFIHRDAERESRESRQVEIDEAIAQLPTAIEHWIPIISVRMTEAWLLMKWTWPCTFREHGHKVKLIAPQFIKPYIKSNKNDLNHAEGIAEAVTRPTMRFVPVKASEQQDIQALHWVREPLISARTALVNEVHGLLSE